jgi:serine/threonine protein kinase
MTKQALIFDTPFDTYTSSSVIGEGGTGRVYVVTNGAGEEFALKCLKPECIRSERIKRFKNEIQFCQHCSHPNIVSVHPETPYFRTSPALVPGATYGKVPGLCQSRFNFRYSLLFYQNQEAATP